MPSDKGISSSPYGGEWGLHSELQKKADELVELAESKGLEIRITEGFRSHEYQNALYAKGRTCTSESKVTNAKGGESYHNYGLAFDIVFSDGYAEKDRNGDGKNDWQEVGQYGVDIGLEWGGNWSSFVDKPHFQYTWGLSIDDLKKGDVPPDGEPIDGSVPAESSEGSGGFVGDIVDMSHYFEKQSMSVKNIGVDDRKVKTSNIDQYFTTSVVSKVGLFFYKLAQVLSIFILGYISLLWLVYFLAYAEIDYFISLLSKLTFNKIDIGQPGGVRKLGIFTGFILIVITIIIFNLIPKLFGLIYSLLGYLTNYLSMFT